MGFLRNNIELKNISKTQFRETYFIKNVIENLFNRMLQESKKYNETNVYISKSRHEDDEKNAQHISEDLFQKRVLYLSSMVIPSYPPPSLPRHATFPGKPASSHFAADRCACSLACLSMISFWTASSPPILAPGSGSAGASRQAARSPALARGRAGPGSRASGTSRSLSGPRGSAIGARPSQVGSLKCVVFLAGCDENTIQFEFD